MFPLTEEIILRPSGGGLNGTSTVTTLSTSTGGPQTDPTQAREARNTTKIVVGVLVPIVVLLAAAVFVLWWRRQLRLKRNRPVSLDMTSDPGLDQPYHPGPFANSRGELPLLVQTGNMSEVSPTSSTGAQPPSYLEALASPGDRSGDSVRASYLMPVSKSRR